MATMKLVRIEGGLGVVLPADVIRLLELEEGDGLEVVREGRELRLRVEGLPFEAWDDAFERANRKFKDLFRGMSDE